MVKFTKTIKVKSSTNQIWKIFAHGFNDAHKWMASVSHSYAQTNGESFEGAEFEQVYFNNNNM